MQIAVLIEPLGAQGFRARSGEPFGLSSEGSTIKEALDKLRRMMAELMATKGHHDGPA